ncbi:hypothetical protein JOB18_029837 [Solea senegalensis]|uniref:Uncharacterized protein n=1 Tax=Solea senegalensis TaxID=28829 RepID=A0AAV6R210_SOLSE|nr:hypothetical protein JOB18_029837 [Solea senegalensis]
MKFHLFPRAQKKEVKVNAETRDILFLATTVYHIFQRTHALKGLSEAEKVFHISRIVKKTRKGLAVFYEQVPDISKAKVLAKVVVQDLKEKYGDKLKCMLLEQNVDVEAIVVFHLRRRTEKLFKQTKKSSNWALSFTEIYCLISFVIFVSAALIFSFVL